MNTYNSYLGRLLEGRTPFEREGYYVLYEDESAGYRRSKPDGAEIVSADSFVAALVEGCKNALRTFAAGEANKQVYAFSLDANDHSDFYIYLNTQGCFEQTLSSYQSDSPDYHKPEYIQSLKYNQGDWDFQMWSEHMGEQGRIVSLFEKLAYLVQDLEEDSEPDAEGERPVIVFEAGILKAGYQVLAMRAVIQLVEERAFDILDRTDDFTAFATTENDYIDYSIIMRRTIEPELFARVFPKEREQDQQFAQLMREIEHYSAGEALDYWAGAVNSGGYNIGMPYDYGKSEYEVFLQLERYGSSLAEECLARLLRITDREGLEHEDYNEIHFYIEALRFSGSLSAECAEQCRTIAAVMGEKFDDEAGIMKELLEIANQTSNIK